MTQAAHDPDPFLQIVHVSDMHVFVDKSARAKQTRSACVSLAHTLHQAALQMNPTRARFFFQLSERLLEGIETHDAAGSRRLGPFIANELVNTLPSTTPTWLVVSGDQTTFGDRDSIDLARVFLDDARKAAKELLEIHGNHDAWPETIPFLGPPGQSLAAKQKLRHAGFRVDQVFGPIGSQQSGGPRVELYCIDTVTTGRWDNSLALGFVADAQLDGLAGLVDANAANGPSLRVLVTHHPVAYPPPVPASMMVIKNANTVAARLAGPSPLGIVPLVHLVLSGHTHELFPKAGQLGACPGGHSPLGPDQTQLVVGTATQRDPFDRRAPLPCQLQALRFYRCAQVSPRKHTVVVERIIAGRNKVGPYKMQPGPTGVIGEKFVVAL